MPVNEPSSFNTRRNYRVFRTPLTSEELAKANTYGLFETDTILTSYTMVDVEMWLREQKVAELAKPDGQPRVGRWSIEPVPEVSP